MGGNAGYWYNLQGFGTDFTDFTDENGKEKDVSRPVKRLQQRFQKAGRGAEKKRFYALRLPREIKRFWTISILNLPGLQDKPKNEVTICFLR